MLKVTWAVTVLADVERILRLVVESSVESGVGLHKRAVTAEKSLFWLDQPCGCPPAWEENM